MTNSLTKSDLFRELAQRFPWYSERDVNRMADVLVDEIAGAVVGGGRVEIRGFGVFHTRFREARQGRNPRNGTTVTVPARYGIAFKAGKALRDQVAATEPTFEDSPYR